MRRHLQRWMLLPQVMKLYMEEVRPEAAQTEEVQPEQTQTEVQPEVAQTEEVQAEEAQDEFQTGETAEEAAFVDGFTDSSAEADPAEFTDGTGEVGDAVETTVDSDFRFENEEVIITAKVFDETALPENAEMNAVKLEAGSEIRRSKTGFHQRPWNNRRRRVHFLRRNLHCRWR